MSSRFTPQDSEQQQLPGSCPLSPKIPEHIPITPLVIIGAGPAGLAVLLRILSNDKRDDDSVERSGKRERKKLKLKPGDIKVIDPSGWMVNWEERLFNQQLNFLRSMVMSTPGSRKEITLTEFSRDTERRAELLPITQNLILPHEASVYEKAKYTYFEREKKYLTRPSVSLFNDFCAFLVDSQNLDSHLVIDHVTQIVPGFGKLCRVCKQKGVQAKRKKGKKSRFERNLEMKLGGHRKERKCANLRKRNENSHVKSGEDDPSSESSESEEDEVGEDEVPRVPSYYDVHTSAGEVIRARVVVNCTGSGIPRIPIWARTLSRGFLHSNEFCVSEFVTSRIPRSVLIVGGGQTGAQLADVISSVPSSFTTLRWIHRRQMIPSHFDVSIDWIGFGHFSDKSFVKFREKSFQEREETVSKNLRAGTIQPDLYNSVMKRGQSTKNFVITENTEVVAVVETGEKVKVTFSDATQSEFDLIVLATGYEDKMGKHISELNETFPVEFVGKYPTLTEHLQWREGWNFFLTGALARLVVGPGAHNLEGAQECAKRIATRVREELLK